MTINNILNTQIADTTPTDFTQRELILITNYKITTSIYDAIANPRIAHYSETTNADTSQFTADVLNNLHIKLSRNLTLDELHATVINMSSMKNLIQIFKKLNNVFDEKYSHTLFADIPFSDNVIEMRTETFVLLMMTLTSRNAKNIAPKLNTFYNEILTPNLLKLTSIENAVNNRFVSSETMTAISYLTNRLNVDENALAQIIIDDKLLELIQLQFKNKSKKFSNARLNDLFIKNIMNVMSDNDYKISNHPTRNMCLSAFLSRNDYTIEQINNAINSDSIVEMRSELAIN